MPARRYQIQGMADHVVDRAAEEGEVPVAHRVVAVVAVGTYAAREAMS
jgi:hypothetical protein